MKILRRILTWLIALILILVIVSFFLPSKVHVERSAIIKAAPSVVYGEISNLRNWEHWSPWRQMDPNMKITYSDLESGKGASYSWQSEKKDLGKGDLQISDAKENEYIKTVMHFGDMPAALGSMNLENTPEGVKTTMGMDVSAEEMSWYWKIPAKYFMLFMNNGGGSDYEAGLANLKKYTESISVGTSITPPNDWKIEEVEIPEMKYLQMRGDKPVKFSEMDSTFGKWYKMLYGTLAKNKVTPAGPPIGVYYTYDVSKQETDMAAGVPINQTFKPEAPLKIVTIKTGKVAKIRYFGKYDGIGKAHARIQEWIAANHREQTGAPWEVYIAYPENEKDPAKWVTDICYLIK